MNNLDKTVENILKSEKFEKACNSIKSFCEDFNVKIDEKEEHIDLFSKGELIFSCRPF